MLFDAQNIPVNQVIKADICIVGAGPAGLTLAHELMNQQFKVCIFESGHLDYDEQTQSLCDGETIGDPFVPLLTARRRQFGGAANTWNIPIKDQQLGLKLLPLDSIDFQERDWMPYSGWPFSKQQLQPFYVRAQAICQIGSFNYESEAWKQSPSDSFIFQTAQINTGIIQFGNRAIFTHTYRREIERSTNIDAYLNANVISLETDNTSQRVTHLRATSLQGNEFSVSARMFILATGGIENARLLLLSNQTQKVGLGNQHDLVGRYFMEHPICRWGKWFPSDQKIFETALFYDLHLVDEIPVLGKLSLSEETMQQKQLLNSYAMLHPSFKSANPEAIQSLKTILASMKQIQAPRDGFHHLKKVIKGADDIALMVYRWIRKRKPRSTAQVWGWSKIQHKAEQFEYFEIRAKTEQSPDPNNRVVLGSERDCLGQRKTQLYWRWSSADIHNSGRAQRLFAEAVTAAGLGTVQIHPIEDQQITGGTSDHHMGTTRMHLNPKQGVVDENCQVHGISNLFIAGSSVFPTGGVANPTLTIIALSLRLADHVKQVMTSQTIAIR